jgi:2-polyprenyl-3-methyl-5-hydroxy-6-metoxy-1,4-benzoquinol methylase
MHEDRNRDLDQMMEQMRLKIRDNRRSTDSASASEQRGAQWHRDLGELHRAYDLSQVSLDRGRKRFGRIVLKAAKTVSDLLEPITRRQSEYNAANTRLITHLNGEIEAMHARLNEFAQSSIRQSEENTNHIQLLTRRLAKSYADDIAAHAQALRDLSGRLDAMEQRYSALERRQTEIGDRVQSFDELHQALAQSRDHLDELRQARARLLRMERRLRHLLGAQPASDSAISHPPLPAFETLAAMDYVAFEDRLRDSQTLKEKQRRYLKYFAGKSPVIDAGCGKGEFLELLREAGSDAKGLDLNLDMVLACREQGLEVEQGDAIEYLAGQPDASIGGIFSAQVIEHLTSAQLYALVTLSWRKLKPGGVVVLETLNPESIFVQYRWFWMDPSHVRLVHPQTLQLMLEATGFREVSCEFLKPPHDGMPIPPLHNGAHGSLEAFNQATDYLNKLLYGPWEYAMIGTKTPST